MGPKDGRIAKREPLRFKIDYRNIDRFLSSFATNISEGGVFINTKNIKPIGSKIKLKFLLPNTKKTIKTEGYVMWVNSDNAKGDYDTGMGVKFYEISSEDKELINEVINSMKA